MTQVKLLITGDVETGAVQVAGPVGDMRLMYWLLGEARRCMEREATRREAASENGNGHAGLVVVSALEPKLRG